MASLPGSPLVSRKQRAPVTPQQPRLARPMSQSPATPASPYTPLSMRSFSSAATSIATPSSVPRSGLADIAENWRVKPGKFVSAVVDADFADDEDDDEEFLTTEEALLPPPSLRLRPRAQSYLPPSAPAILRASTRPRENQAQSPLVQRARHSQLLTDTSLTSTPPRNPALARQLRLRGSVTDPAGGRLGAARHRQDAPDLFHISEDEQEEDDDHSIDTNPDESSFYEDPYFPTPSHVSHFYPNAPIPMAVPYPQPFMPTFNAFQYVQPPPMELRTSTPPPPGYAPRSPDVHRKENAYHVDAKESLPVNVPKPTGCSVCGVSVAAADGGKLTLAILSPCTHPLCSACLTSALNIVGEKDMECAVCKKNVNDFKLTTVTASVKEKKRSADTAGTPTAATPSKKRAPLSALDLNSRLAAAAPKRWDELSEESLSDSSLALLKENVGRGKSFFDDPLFSSPGSATSAGREFGLESALNILSKDTTSNGMAGGDCVVLRIDNVPWDITPPMIEDWLGQPAGAITHVHVLLDRKGKTLSHAYVEVNDQETARSILRGEVGSSPRSDVWRPKSVSGEGPTPKKRSGVLGKGRRARGVTVTRSSQEELMAALFPVWPGTFSGSRPSLAGLRNDGVRLALERGLITEGEISVLLGLIRVGEGSHFLKVPTLPFYSLMSILSKFPNDQDSRVFWNVNLRDMLFDVTIAAIKTLRGRLEEGKTSYDGLVEKVAVTAARCGAFTVEQKEQLKALVAEEMNEVLNDDTITKSIVRPGSSSPSTETSQRCDTPAAQTDPQPPQTPRRGSPAPTTARPASTPPCSAVNEKFEFHHLDETLPADRASELTEQTPAHSSETEMEKLAKEFGVEAGVVKALMERLASSSSKA